MDSIDVNEKKLEKDQLLNSRLQIKARRQISAKLKSNVN